MKYSDALVVLSTLARQNKPVLVQGPPGVGKSSLMTDVADRLGMNLIISHPIVSEPTDYKGLPAPVTVDGETFAMFLPYGDLRTLVQTEEPTLFFLDDMGQAPPATQAALMQLTLVREINGQKLSPKVCIMGATNRRGDKAGVQGLLQPLLDRFITTFTLDFHIDDFADWMHRNEMPPELVSFCRFKPDLLGKFTPSKDMTKQPTPRSVAGLGDLIKLQVNHPEVWQGAVGDGFATEFMAFQRTWRDLPTLDSIYKNPTGIKIPEKPDVLYALMGSLASGLTPKTFPPTIKFLERVRGEFSVLCIKDALSRNRKLGSDKNFTDWAVAHADLLGIVK